MKIQNKTSPASRYSFFQKPSSSASEEQFLAEALTSMVRFAEAKEKHELSFREQQVAKNRLS